MAASFNLIAPVYDALAFAVYGKTLFHAKTAFLNQLPEDAHVLLLGGGTGHALGHMLELHPRIRVDFVEPSPGMMRMAKKNLKASYHHRVTFICANHQGIPDGICYDAIAAFFVLDLLREEEGHDFLSITAAHLKPGAPFFFADFFYTGRIAQRALIWIMYRFFRLVSNIPASELPRYEVLFGEAGLKMKNEKMFWGEMIRSRIYTR